MCVVVRTMMVLVSFIAAPAWADTVLSGLVEFQTDSTGKKIDPHAWNTLAGDGLWNLWVEKGGVWQNGPSDAQAGISISLADGDHTFVLYGNSAVDALGTDTHWGLNLFFGGDNANPRISVFAPLDTTSPGVPAFQANGGNPTRRLDASDVPGAGTLSFTDGATTVALIDYWWSYPDVRNVDLADPYVLGSDGRYDYTGQFTLRVQTERASTSTVPEPATSALLAMVVTGVVAAHRRQRRQ